MPGIGLGLGVGIAEVTGGVKGPRPKLDLKFASSLSLTSSSGITPSFSRASSGTYFGADGLLKYAVVNSFQYSEDFTNAYWIKSGVSVSGNSAVAPDGKTTADKIIENSAGGIKYGTISGGFSVTSGTTYCFSVYLKDSGRYLGFATNSTAFPNAIGAVFNPSNGTISNIQPNTTASIQDVGNGWYRCSISGTANATTITNINFGVSNDLNQIYPSYTGNGSSGYFLWGIQMETASTPGTYVPTTSSANSAPRFDHNYNGTSWVSKGLLVEEQRTNVVPKSADFTVGWTGANASTTTASGTAPDGTNSAVKLYAITSTTQTRIYRSSTQSCISVFAKAVEKAFVYFYDKTGANVCWFNLSTGSVGTNSTGLIAGISNCGNGWFRCSLAASSGVFSYFQIGVCDADASTSSTASGTNGILIWGAQEESGLFPTSYIPNDGSSGSVTRSADVCQITGSDFSSFWNATEGSFACEFDLLAIPTSDTTTYVAHQSGSAWIGQRLNSTGAISGVAFDVYSGGIQQARLIASMPTVNTLSRSAGCYKANDFAYSFNGASVLTDASGSVPSPTSLQLGNFPSFGEYLNGHIARLRYFNKRLTNKQLEDLCKPEEQLKLDLKFSENLSLTPVVGPTPSFSRASTGTYINASGVLSSAAINAPRFDYTFDGTNWISRGLLIEEQRTNSITNSNNFATSFASGPAQFASAVTTSPDGTNNAWKIFESAPAGGSLDQRRYANFSISGQNTISIFAKAAERKRLLLFSNGPNQGSWFDLSNGTSGNIDTYTGATQSMQPVGNGWYRCSMTVFGGTATVQIQIMTDGSTSNPSRIGDGISGIYIAFIQGETGAFPTSYIPTTSSSVTRSADVCQITGTGFSGMWNATEGSVAAEYIQLRPLNIGTVIGISDGGTSNAMFDYASEGQSGGVDYGPSFYIRSSGTFTVSTNFGNLLSGQQKYAVGFRLNDFAGSYLGQAVQTDNTVTIPVVNQMGIGKPIFPQYPFSGHISRLRYYAIRLPDRLLIAKSQ